MRKVWRRACLSQLTSGSPTCWSQKLHVFLVCDAVNSLPIRNPISTSAGKIGRVCATGRKQKPQDSPRKRRHTFFTSVFKSLTLICQKIKNNSFLSLDLYVKLKLNVFKVNISSQTQLNKMYKKCALTLSSIFLNIKAI